VYTYIRKKWMWEVFVRPDKAIEGLDQPRQGRETRYHCSLYKRNHLSHL